jgi:hypothetical protein
MSNCCSQQDQSAVSKIPLHSNIYFAFLLARFFNVTFILEHSLFLQRRWRRYHRRKVIMLFSQVFNFFIRVSHSYPGCGGRGSGRNKFVTELCMQIIPCKWCRSILNGQHFAFSSLISPSSLICSCVFLIHWIEGNKSNLGLTNGKRMRTYVSE